MRHKLCLLWSWWVRLTTAGLPDLPACMRWRGWLYGLAMRRRGRDFQAAAGARLVGLENLSVGDHVYLAPGSVVLAAADVTLADEVMLAYGAVVTDGDHTAAGGSYRFGPRRNAPVRVERGTWIGANAVVLAGVTVGAGTLVAAGAVASRDLPAGCVAGGSPARVIRAADERRDAAGAGSGA